MNRRILKDVMKLKLTTIDKILDSIPGGANNPIVKVHRDFIEVIHEVTGDFIKDRDSAAKEDAGKGVKKIEIK